MGEQTVSKLACKTLCSVGKGFAGDEVENCGYYGADGNAESADDEVFQQSLSAAERINKILQNGGYRFFVCTDDRVNGVAYDLRQQKAEQYAHCRCYKRNNKQTVRAAHGAQQKFCK